MKGSVTSVEQVSPQGGRRTAAAVDDLPTVPELQGSRYAKWRALSLSLVYVLMVAHIVHWKVAGKTMAPLELSEVMKVLEMRVITAGAIFIGLMFLGTAVFGRFFCSWACHMLAAQDLSHWILEKLRIRPRPIRSRVLLWVPILPACYVFVFPALRGWWKGHTPSSFSTRVVTTDLWHDLPGPLVATLTFVTCGFLIVYMLGGRGFCNYGCPYGVLFGLFNRIAPGKIRARDGCVQCAKCTTACTSGVRVHEEVMAYGMVLNRQCLKDLDCVSVCPRHVLHYSFRGGASDAARPGFVDRRTPRHYDFTWPEELVMGGAFAVAFVVLYGLYRMVPFFLAVGIGVITAYAALLLVRLLYARPVVKLQKLHLRNAHGTTVVGWVFGACVLLYLVFLAHSAPIQWHFRNGKHYFELATAARVAGKTDIAREAMDRSLRHLSVCERSGLVHTRGLGRMLGQLSRWNGQPAAAVAHFQKDLTASTRSPVVPVFLGASLTELGRDPEAEKYYRLAVGKHLHSADQCNNLAAALARHSEFAAQLGVLRAGVEKYPAAEGLALDLCTVLAQSPDQNHRDPDGAIRVAEQFLAANDGAGVQMLPYLAWMYSRARRHDDAVRTARLAVELASAKNLPGLAEAMATMTQSYRDNANEQETLSEIAGIIPVD